jgi:mycothiol system anti-sigma-R factor
MDCRAASDLVHRYVDGEVSPATAAEIDRHVDGCAACRPVYERHRALQNLIRRSAIRHAAPSTLAERIGAALEAAPSVAAPARSRWRAAALAASLLLTAGLSSAVTWVATTGHAPTVAQDVVASHVRSLMANHLTDIASSDQHTVKPWFNGRIDVAPPVRDLADQGFPLIGGRLDYLGGRPVAALVYRHDRHVINLFVWPAGASQGGGGAAKAQGYNLRHWREGAAEYWAISDLNTGDLAAFERLIRAQ